MITLDMADQMIKQWSMKLRCNQLPPPQKFLSLMDSIEGMFRACVKTKDSDGMDGVSILTDALFIVIECGLFDVDPPEAATMLGVMAESSRRLMCEMHGFRVEQFDLVERERHRHLLFLRPRSSSNRYHLFNYFKHAKREIIKFPVEPPMLTLEASLMRIFQPTHKAMSVGGIYDAFGMGRVYIIGNDRDEEWKTAVKSAANVSNIIFFVPSETQGMVWEYNFLKAHRLMHKVVACMLPIEKNVPIRDFLNRNDNYSTLAQDWEAARKICAESGIYLPKYDQNGAFLFFGHDGRVAKQVAFESLWTTDLVQEVLRQEDLHQPTS